MENLKRRANARKHRRGHALLLLIANVNTLLASSVLFCVFCTPAIAAEHTQVEVLSAAVATPLKAAQQAISKSDWKAALEKLKEAQAAKDLTPQGQYSTDELLGYVLIRQKNYADAITVYERLLKSPKISAHEVDDHTKTLVTLYYGLKNYPQAIKWASKALEKNPEQQDMREILGESYYQVKDYKKAIATMNMVVANAQRNQQIPKESWLRIIDDSADQLQDRRAVASALTALVRYYQEPGDWDALLVDRVKAARDAKDRRLIFAYHRLMFELGILKGPDAYEELALEAMDAKLPDVAQGVIERGVADGVFKEGEKIPGRRERILKDAQQQAAADKSELARFAATKSGGVSAEQDIDFGRRYLSDGNYPQAIQALKRGLEQGGVTNASELNEAKIDLGIAYLKSQQKALAQQTFDSVDKHSKWGDLATLWSLRLAAPTSVASAEDKKSAHQDASSHRSATTHRKK